MKKLEIFNLIFIGFLFGVSTIIAIDMFKKAPERQLEKYGTCRYGFIQGAIITTLNKNYEDSLEHSCGFYKD